MPVQTRGESKCACLEAIEGKLARTRWWGSIAATWLSWEWMQARLSKGNLQTTSPQNLSVASSENGLGRSTSLRSACAWQHSCIAPGALRDNFNVWHGAMVHHKLLHKLSVQGSRDATGARGLHWSSRVHS